MSRKLLLGSLAVGTGLLVLVLQGELEPRHARRVGDFLATGPRDQEVLVNGFLVHGTLCRVTEECGYRFAMADGFQSPNSPAPPSLSVQYDGCVIPDSFRDVEGLYTPIMVRGERCESCHDFRATDLLAKCIGKYEMRVDGGVVPYAAPPSPPPPPRCDALAPRM